MRHAAMRRDAMRSAATCRAHCPTHPRHATTIVRTFLSSRRRLFKPTKKNFYRSIMGFLNPTTDPRAQNRLAGPLRGGAYESHQHHPRRTKRPRHAAHGPRRAALERRRLARPAHGRPGRKLRDPPKGRHHRPHPRHPPRRTHHRQYHAQTATGTTTHARRASRRSRRVRSPVSAATVHRCHVSARGRSTQLFRPRSRAATCAAVRAASRRRSRCRCPRGFSRRVCAARS